MKKMKKLVSLLLATVMVFAMTITAFADTTTGTITVDNPIVGQTYTAYKIFDVTYNGDKTKYSYSIKSDSEWYATVNAYATKANSGLTLTKANGSTSVNTYYVTIEESKFSAPAFSNTLKAAVSDKTGIALTLGEDGKAKVENLELGYYFVTSSTGALCNLTTTNPTVTIHDKNDVPFEKVDDKTDVEIGQTVNYTITGKVPDYTGFTTYDYKITDTMSAGLTFKKDAKVTVGGTDVTAACTVTYDVDSNANKFTVSIPVKSYTIGSEIKVTYSAVVNENAIAKIEKNHAELNYSNDPTDKESHGTRTDEETVYSSKIVIDKYDANNIETKLTDASFILYKNVTTDEGTEEEVTTKWYYKWNDTDKKVEWVQSVSDATHKTTDANGAADFGGLANGTYYLEETAAPAGYNLLNEPKEVEINGGDTEAQLSVTADVANSTGALLPSTGGMGTTIFYVLGAILVLGAGVILITRRRMSSK